MGGIELVVAEETWDSSVGMTAAKDCCYLTSDARYFVVALVMGIFHPFLVISANHINIFHKTEVQTVILSCSTDLNLNCIKSYNRKHKKFHFLFL